ncbi:LacI family DNA-binding transcriptional regulator [Verrucomicrobium sp. BvORR106]|uniref:LacI family DNA-binding transcriptional regulator n=1 Tax=Verrucomicrobium sp. BvORR106 TaxID=1403819 RepID=UPI0009DE9E35|nr:LacI family DNA-binding transcriptional regulator [Verrucomicrobium sp. BvORR106]
MEEVARAAGVSRSTVSRALSNHPRLPAERCVAIQSLAAAMGYRRNAMVSALMADLKSHRRPRTVNTVAYVTAHPTREGWRQPNPSFIEYYEGARDRAAEQGYLLETFWIQDPALGVERFNKMLHTRHIRGVLIAPMPEPNGTVPLCWGHHVAIAIGHTLLEPAVSRVVPNFYQGNLVTLEHLHAQGARRIGFATDAKTHERVQLSWLAAYLVFQQRLPASRRLPPFICPDAEGTGMAEWMHAHRPDAVVGTQNQILGWDQSDRHPCEHAGRAHLCQPQHGATPWRPPRDQSAIATGWGDRGRSGDRPDPSK